MFVYVEFISRRPHVALADFHAVASQGQGGWADAYSADQLLLNIGRTWRIGPEPEYLAIWYTPASGLERLGEWERTFASGEADNFEKPMELVARLDRAGCYVPLVEPKAHRGGRYCVEYFEFASGATRASVTEWFVDRQHSSGRELCVLVDRIGAFGPDPRGLAVWALDSYADLEGLASETTGEVPMPVELVTCGLYAELGEEVL